MKFNLYSLRDVKLERSQPPFVCRDDNEARIIILRAGFRKDVYQDLDLFKVGEFDDVSGVIENSNCVRIGLLPFAGGVLNENVNE